MTPDHINDLLKKYDVLTLECDGITRVLSYVLAEQDIEHKVFFGSVNWLSDYGIPWHCWITIGPYTVDYRLKMWLPSVDGVTLPNGVFKAQEHSLSYFPSEQIILISNEAIFEALTKGSEFWLNEITDDSCPKIMPNQYIDIGGLSDD